MKRVFIGSLVLLGVGMGLANPFEARFDQAWRLVKELYWDTAYNGTDWDAVGERYRARLQEVHSWEALYRLLDEMYRELGDDHSAFLSPAEARRALKGAACLPVPFPEVWEAPPPDATALPEPEETEPLEALEGKVHTERMGEVGYLRVPHLIDPSIPGTLRDAIRAFEAQGVQGYVLDLRDNPGGLALSMAEVASLFMRGVPWRVVTRTLGVMPQPTLPFWGRPDTEKPLVILTNANVHSAAEGLVGALQRAGRGVVVGERTAGNTEVLLPYCFPDGAVAFVATGVLAPLSGPTWEGRGIEPDLVEPDPDRQLERALEYLHARIPAR